MIRIRWKEDVQSLGKCNINLARINVYFPRNHDWARSTALKETHRIGMRRFATPSTEVKGLLTKIYDVSFSLHACRLLHEGAHAIPHAIPHAVPYSILHLVAMLVERMETKQLLPALWQLLIASLSHTHYRPHLAGLC